MEDYSWNKHNDKLIAKLLPFGAIEPDRRARLSNQEICAIMENGDYIDNHTGDCPILIPKPTMLGWLIGKRTPKRDHLFVHKGPHDVDLEIKATWGSGERGRVTAEMTVEIPSRGVGPLFELAGRCDGNEITPDDLAKTVQRKIIGTYAEYVMGLSDKPITEEELRAHQYKFDQIADDEFGKWGVHVTDGVLRYRDDPHTTLGHLSDENAAEREKIDEEGYHDFSGGMADVEKQIKKVATDGAGQDELIKSAGERIGRRVIDAGEDAAIGEVEERKEEKGAAIERRKILREGRLMETKVDAVRRISKKKSEEDE